VSAWPISPEPFRIEPIFVPRIWGARSLAPLYPEKTVLSEPIGEAWLTGIDCKVASGPFAGKTLGEAWREMPVDWRGSNFQRPCDFPLLVKFIFPMDKLSIQVHPDDAYAAAHEQAAGGRGKTEMWHVVLAERGAHVLIGTKPGVSKRQVLDAIAGNTLENLLEKHLVYNGDTFFVPAGTPHTIGPGMVLCEVQEYSDLTYRVYDYGRKDAKGRPRDLHVQKALEVMHLGQTTGGKVPSLPLYSGSSGVWGKRTLLSACRYFAVERWEFYKNMGGISLRKGFSFDLLVVLNGKGQMGWSNNTQIAWKERHKWGRGDFQAGQCWFVPACLAVAGAAPHAAMLRAYVPDLTELKTYREEDIGRTVFD
jgi:mannose-6-phosphate isomerase